MSATGLRQPTREPIMTLKGIGKSFGPVRALEDVGFDIYPGSVHGLVGENGAGKSTLVKIITGLEQADQGEVILSGKRVRFRTPIEARNHGVAAVYQDAKLFPHLSVAENVAMGAYPAGPLGMFDRRQMIENARAHLVRLGSDLDPRRTVAGLSVAEHQFVEIARALSLDVRVLILDEPTSALTPTEAERLFAVMRALKERGTAIIFITHRLEEVEALSDEITVLRDRRHVATLPRAEVDRAKLVQLMVGRPLEALFSRRERPSFGEEALRVEHLSLDGVFADVSFSVRAGEIVGMGGLVGGRLLRGWSARLHRGIAARLASAYAWLPPRRRRSAPAGDWRGRQSDRAPPTACAPLPPADRRERRVASGPARALLAISTTGWSGIAPRSRSCCARMSVVFSPRRAGPIR
jgi:rhamnose transport system ATP-binding protein